jgi:hypothetical protein
MRPFVGIVVRRWGLDVGQAGSGTINNPLASHIWGCNMNSEEALDVVSGLLKELDTIGLTHVMRNCLNQLVEDDELYVVLVHQLEEIIESATRGST